MDRREQLGIQASKTSQGLGVSTISLAGVVIDRPQFTGVGDQDVVAQVFDEMTGPTRVSADLHGYSGRLERGELALEGCLGRGQARFFDQFALLVENDEV